MEGNVHYKINTMAYRASSGGEKEKRKNGGNKPGKFIFPRGLPLKFRPSKNGTPNGNRSHNDVYNYRAPIERFFGLRQTFDNEIDLKI